MADKEIEYKVKEVMTVVELGFRMPENMTISLMQISTSLLTKVVDVSKDFLHLQVLDLLTMVAKTCDQAAFRH